MTTLEIASLAPDESKLSPVDSLAIISDITERESFDTQTGGACKKHYHCVKGHVN